METRPKILLFATVDSAPTARLGLSLSSKGCQVATVVPVDHGVRKVKAFAAHYQSASYAATEAFVARAIETYAPDMVIACDDPAVNSLYELHAVAGRGFGREPERIRTVIETSLGDPANFSIARKKSAFTTFAKTESLSVPDTFAIRDLRDLLARLETSTFPQVLKIDESTAGAGVRIVKSCAEAERAYSELVAAFGWLKVAKWALKTLSLRPLLRRWRDRTPTITLQRYVNGVPANRAVLCWRGDVLAGLSVEVVQAMGETGPATVVRIINQPEMADACRQLVHSLCLSGFVGFDFILEAATGRAFLLEMNPRPTQICHFSLDAETDMTGALVAKLSGQAQARSEVPHRQTVIALFPGEMWRDPGSSYLQSSHHDVPWEEPQLIRAYARAPSPGPWNWVRGLWNGLRSLSCRSLHLIGRYCGQSSCDRTVGSSVGQRKGLPAWRRRRALGH